MADAAKLDELIAQLDNMTLSEERRRPKFKMPELARLRRQEYNNDPKVDLLVEVLNNAGHYEEVARFSMQQLPQARARLAEEVKIAQAERARGKLRITARNTNKGLFYVVEAAKINNNSDMFYYPLRFFKTQSEAAAFVDNYDPDDEVQS